MVKLMVGPVHPLFNGVTMTVPVIFDPVMFAGAVHGLISPVPDAPSPIAILLFDHEYVVPVRLLVKTGTFMVAAGHTAILLNCVTVGVGYIVTVKLIVLPIQPLAEVGVTVIVPVMFDNVPLAGAIHEFILPVPDAPKPIDVLLFVHVYAVPVRLLEKAGIVIVTAEHTAMSLNCVAVGVGYMATVKFIGVPIQPLVDIGVTVIIPVIFDDVALVGAVHELISPDPETPKPIDVLLFVHVYVVPVRLLEKAGIVMVAAGHTVILLNCVTVGVG
jgi:hypothetical protein